MSKRLILDEASIIESYLNGLNIYELGEQHSCNYGTIRNVLLRNKVALRCKSDAAKSKRTVEISKCHGEIIDGLLLGDGSVFQRRRTANFRLKSIEPDFTDNVKNVLPFVFSDYTENAMQVYIKGKLCSRKKTYIIESRVYQSLNVFRDRWYRQDVKIVPKDLVLTPAVCKYWFYSDGYTSRIHANGNDNCVVLGLCTNSFTKDDTLFLRDKLRELGFDFRIAKKVKGHVLQARKKESVNGFLEYVDKPNVQCFSYKWKYHNGSRPCRRLD